MATTIELAERLHKRFKGVPNFTIEDAIDLIDDSLHEHRLAPSDSTASNDESLILLYAQAEGAWQIALSSAHYFTYRDGEEQVDKSKVSEQYRKLANDLRVEYEREKNARSGAAFKVSRRLDR